MDYWQMRAALEWQVEMGAGDAILDEPVDRYATSAAAAAERAAPSPTPTAPARIVAPEIDAVAVATAAASAAQDLTALAAALRAFEHCDLKKGARNMIFADGPEDAPVLVVGDAPSRDDDLEGRPFTGRPGALFDAMFDAIGLSRGGEGQASLRATYAVPWRPPQNRDATPEELDMLRPFLLRHIELAAPKVVVAMGNTATAALLDRIGITRLRGTWAEVAGRPVLPMLPPDRLLRVPLAKREAWSDLLQVKARLAV